MKAWSFALEEADGATNMALDELLWRRAARRQEVYVRTYRWSDRPCLSLGYFQPAAEVQRRPPLRNINLVRRLTGGGAIVHDRELTYALVCPARMAPCRDWLYERFHKAVAAGLARFGLAARLGGPTPLDGCRRASPSVLCFHRPDPLGLYAGRCKIMGSAQRRGGGTVLMHGSLLLAASPLAPDCPGICDLTTKRLDVPPLRELHEVMVAAAERSLGIRCRPTALQAELRTAARELARTKYRARYWTFRR